MFFKSFRLLSKRYPLYSTLKDQLAFTPAFSQALRSKLSSKPPNQFLRLEIFAGQGCEGFTYKFKFDSTLHQSDKVGYITNQADRPAFAVDSAQLSLLKGSILDYSTSMMREVFYVKENPNAELSCSCKTSFSPKENL